MKMIRFYFLLLIFSVFLAAAKAPLKADEAPVSQNALQEQTEEWKRARYYSVCVVKKNDSVIPRPPYYKTWFVLNSANENDVDEELGGWVYDWKFYVKRFFKIPGQNKQFAEGHIETIRGRLVKDKAFILTHQWNCMLNWD